MNEATTISGVLEPEHRWIDERFARFRGLLADGHVNKDPFQEATMVLHRHMYVEEEILFPEVEARGLAGPVAVMLQEHGEICRILNNVQDLIGSRAQPRDIEDSLKAVLHVLEDHSAKEEQVLYPTADQVLDGPEFTQLVQRIKEATPPEGWVCRTHSSGG